MKAHTVWTLNDASLLLEPNKERIQNVFNIESSPNPFRVKFGHRSPFNDKAKVSIHPFNLMYEDENPFSEYFVPIPLKCIGNKYANRHELSASGRAIMDTITTSYDYFSTPDKFNRFWNGDHEGLPKVRMMTHDGLGYYSILEKTAPNILIGYSQGGLVARYLAFLDEYVFEKQCITAVITIDSPNFGSPLANPENKDAIFGGLVECMLALLGCDRRRMPLVNRIMAKSITFDGVIDAVEIALRDAQREHAAAEIKRFSRVLSSAEKWLSGLKADADSAFSDLNIATMADEASASVLNLVNSYPLQRVLHGAIIGTNANLDDLVRSFQNVAVSMGWGLFTKYFKILGCSLAHNIAAASKIYKEKVMLESHFDNHARRIAAIVGKSNKGMTPFHAASRSRIKPHAHDFVVPSVYQLLPTGGAGYIGVRVNKHANHNSGREPNKTGGRQNFRYIMEFLKMIQQRQKRQPSNSLA